MDTKHGQARANQRGYTAALLDLIHGYGTWDGDRQVLFRPQLLAYLAEIDALRRSVIKLLDKGGGAVVYSNGDELITVFKPRAGARRPRHRPQYS